MSLWKESWLFVSATYDMSVFRWMVSHDHEVMFSLYLDFHQNDTLRLFPGGRVDIFDRAWVSYQCRPHSSCCIHSSRCQHHNLIHEEAMALPISNQTHSQICIKQRFTSFYYLGMKALGGAQFSSRSVCKRYICMNKELTTFRSY